MGTRSSLRPARRTRCRASAASGDDAVVDLRDLVTSVVERVVAEEQRAVEVWLPEQPVWWTGSRPAEPLADVLRAACRSVPVELVVAFRLETSGRDAVVVAHAHGRAPGPGSRFALRIPLAA